MCYFCIENTGIDDLRVTIYDVARSLQKSGRAQVSVMGEKIPHSFLLVADVIQAKRQELRDKGRMPIMHKSEYEALVLDTIKNDTLDIEDTNDLLEVTQFMHERGKHDLADWLETKLLQSCFGSSVFTCTGCLFSYVWHRSPVFPRFSLVICFRAPDTGCELS